VIKIDAWYEILTAGLVILACLGVVYAIVALVLRFLEKRSLQIGRVKSDPASPAACAPYVAEHTQLFQEVKEFMAEVISKIDTVIVRVNENDESTGALIAAAVIQQRRSRRELSRMKPGERYANGEMDEVDRELSRAQESYRNGRRIAS
jgi:hypothetical protein